MSVQLCLQPVYPLPGQQIRLKEGRLNLTVQVTLSCGMPTCAGGRWNPERFKLTARLISADQREMTTDLHFSGRASEFSGSVETAGSGSCSLLVYAQDPETGAAGRLNIQFRIKTV